jgi:glycosyltransferase involved in cell wall biosynthesis
MIAAKMANVPIRLHTVAGLPLMTSQGLRKKILFTTEKVTYYCSSETLANSYSIASFMLKEQMIDINKLKVLGNGSTNGFDNNRFNFENLNREILGKIKSEISYNNDLFYYLYVGRLVVDKGIDELYEAFHKLYARNKNLRLIILGTFEKERDSLKEQRVVEIINHPGIIFLGWRDDVEYFIALSNALVHPSHREGFPNILLQAAAMNTPIICSRIPGNIDIVNEENASLYTVKNSQELFNKMNEMFVDYNSKLDQANLFGVSIVDRFSRESVQQLILEYYTEKLKAKSIIVKNNPSRNSLEVNNNLTEQITALKY